MPRIVLDLVAIRRHNNISRCSELHLPFNYSSVLGLPTKLHDVCNVLSTSSASSVQWDARRIETFPSKMIFFEGFRVHCFNRILRILIKSLFLLSKTQVFPGSSRAHWTTFIFSFLYHSNSRGLFCSSEQDERMERRRSRDTLHRVNKFGRRQKF